ncbi:DNA methyltransferase [Caproiciproducens sp.]|uniref:DNA methyltransferase n=1 Tax=Caproiciproducens sp. TaxID=1954376 RepID=UPI00289D439C|nr:DNA methyltransferase [Caproiciproducens sp.]
MKLEKQLNYALVEDTRPPMYKGMKYWGKKPHNIWREFIEWYCPPDGVVLDPFVGSGVAAFESAIARRRVIAFDINPMSSFFIEVSTCTFNEKKFSDAANKIIEKVSEDTIYKEHYKKDYNGSVYTIYNYVWQDGTVWKINAKSSDHESKLFMPEISDKQRCLDMESLQIPYWYPCDKFPNTPSINGKFIRDVGGNDFSFLWTKRNLYLLSKIFDLIKQQDNTVQLPLLYAFVHTLHLVSKMVVARQEKGNRSFSGSWGRADYMIRNRRLEQNPLIVFERACFDRQGVLNSLIDAHSRIPQKIKLNDVCQSNKYKSNVNINYGKMDVADLLDYIPAKSVDFIITDPPYGGLVQYMDLSLIWLVWLQNYDIKYAPNLSAEITVKKGSVSRDMYKRRLTNAFVNLHRVLKDDGYMVVTFHNKEMQEWNDFTNSVRDAGFKFDKVTHQYNKRSGESNVSNPYGTAGSDFYIRCTKRREVDFSNDTSALEHFILQKSIEVIARRAEPTPYDFIQNGVLPELLQAGYLQPEEPSQEINKVLSQYIGEGTIFKIEATGSKAGDLWWFNNPSEYINYPDIPLTDRVDETVLSFLRRRISVKLDDVIAELFKMYPNGLTPDPHNIRAVLEKYAFQSSGKWKLKDSVENEVTKHSYIISLLCKIGKRMEFKTFIGRREQPEHIANNQILRDIADYSDLRVLGDSYDDIKIDRIAMIDCLFIRGKEISIIFEVENSTNFSSAIIRASNTTAAITKYMIIPDHRVDELEHFIDPLFRTSFRENHWKYIKYSDIERLATLKTSTKEDLDGIAKELTI